MIGAYTKNAPEGSVRVGVPRGLMFSEFYPLYNAFLTELGFEVVAGKTSTYVDVAALIGAAINFLIVAAVVYFVIVVPLNALKARRKSGEEAGPAEPTDVELLIEIRDLLRSQQR